MVRERLESAGAAWVDGRATAGHQGAQVKHNLQLAEDAPVARELGAHRRRARWSAIRCSSAPRCRAGSIRRCSTATTGPTAMQFGTHVDGAVRLLPGTGDEDPHRRLGHAVPVRARGLRRRRAPDRGRLRDADASSSRPATWCSIRQAACIA